MARERLNWSEFRATAHEAGRERDGHDRDDAEATCEVEGAQHESHRHLEQLRGEQDAAAVDAVRDRPSQQHEGQQGQLLREAAQPEIEGVAETGLDQPGQRDVLRPGADAGQERPRPEQTERAVREAGQESRQLA
jgi:hypothetical protein